MRDGVNYLLIRNYPIHRKYRSLSAALGGNVQAVDQMETRLVRIYPADTVDYTARMMLEHRITGLRAILSTGLRDETQRNAVEAFLANAERQLATTSRKS